ncbi:hypothetical protein FWK35_00003117 [Aphis craccivora]|uniref:Uncharacterized protein n=1 Tax=Aphis craccivora TaxID=307492 RepID=A0A6G0Z1R1_APHCR|nr:hypothetical protein FWK35_00003117 [Aphis craccivora]
MIHTAPNVQQSGTHLPLNDFIFYLSTYRLLYIIKLIIFFFTFGSINSTEHDINSLNLALAIPQHLYKINSH